MRHLLGQFGNQAGASALSYFGGQFPHGFLGDHAAFPAGKRGATIVKGLKKRHTAAFAFLPQRKRFLYGAFLVLEPPTFDGAASECSLIRCKLHFHGLLLL
jgi:hypothetical protein